MKMHIAEAGGAGGVYQHSLRVAQIIGSSSRDVTFHTAIDARDPHPSDVNFCFCHKWFRSASPSLRPILVTCWYLFYVIPHLCRSSGTVWVQGSFKPPLTLALSLALTVSRHRFAFSPHNSFDRSGKLLNRICHGMCVRLARELVLYNDSDFLHKKSNRQIVHRLPLVTYVPSIELPKADVVQRVHELGRPLIGLFGQLRSDKNYPFAVRVAEGVRASVLIVGEDKGDAESILSACHRSAISTFSKIEYVSLPDLAWYISQCDIILCPYSVGSQSAVASLANGLNVLVLSHGLPGGDSRLHRKMANMDEAQWVMRVDALLRDRNFDCQDTAIEDVSNEYIRVGGME